MLVSAGILIIRDVSEGPEILLLKSAEFCRWGPPKGHLEKKENVYQAAIREVKEETGIRKDQIKILKGFQRLITYISGSKRQKSVLYFMAKLTDKTCQVRLSQEHSAYGWMKCNEAITLVDSPVLTELIQRAFSFYSEH